MSVACRLRPDALPVCHFPHSLTTTLHVHPANLSGGGTWHLSLSNRHTCLTLILHRNSPSFAIHDLLAPIASSCVCRNARTAGSFSSKKMSLRSASSVQEEGSQGMRTSSKRISTKSHGVTVTLLLAARAALHTGTLNDAMMLDCFSLSCHQLFGCLAARLRVLALATGPTSLPAALLRASASSWVPAGGAWLPRQVPVGQASGPRSLPVLQALASD